MKIVQKTILAATTTAVRRTKLFLNMKERPKWDLAHHIPYKEERFINPFIVKRTNSSALQGYCFQDWLRSQIQQHVYYGLFIVSTSKCFRLLVPIN